MSHAKLATLGIDPAQIIQTLAAQNAVRRPACSTRRPTGSTCGRPARSTRVDAIRDIGIRANGRLFRLGDIARVDARLRRPAAAEDALQGQEAIGLGVSMVQGRRRDRAGRDLDARRSRACRQQLPVGIELAPGLRPAARRAALDQRVHALADRGGADRARGVASSAWACAPGWSSRCRSRWCWRSPSCCMWLFGIDLHRISLGALIIVARPAGRRRDHRRRNDGGQDGAGLRPVPRRDLRLHLAPPSRC